MSRNRSNRSGNPWKSGALPRPGRSTTSCISRRRPRRDVAARCVRLERRCSKPAGRGYSKERPAVSSPRAGTLTDSLQRSNVRSQDAWMASFPRAPISRIFFFGKRIIRSIRWDPPYERVRPISRPMVIRWPSDRVRSSSDLHPIGRPSDGDRRRGVRQFAGVVSWGRSNANWEAPQNGAELV